MWKRIRGRIFEAVIRGYLYEQLGDDPVSAPKGTYLWRRDILPEQKAVGRRFGVHLVFEVMDDAPNRREW